LESFTAGVDGLLFNASPLPTIVVDGDSREVIAANEAAAERYGYSSEQMVSLQLADLVDPESPARPIASRELSSGETMVVELQRHRRKDGTVFPVHCASREFLLGDRRVVMLVITELSELRPVEAEQRFVEKMEAMSRLGGGIAHSFNNLMTAILATTDLALASAEIPQPIREDLQSIRDAGQRAAAITRQLMAFSGSQSVTLRQTDINQLLEQLTPLLQHVLPTDVTLLKQLRATAMVEIDPARFEQVILNLVMNAVDAMPNGGVLTLSTDDLNAFVSIIVADSGSGMDEITLARLFEPFHSTKGPGSGRGLGLASVYGSVRQMNGSTDIESGLGKGTRVRMFFPQAIPTVDLEFPPPAASRVVTGGEVVLVVEDEPSVRAPIIRTLRNLGYFVLEADNGEHALRVMQEHHAPVHLVISDVMMPEMDGTELVTLLRGWYPRMRVLFISGYSPQYLEGQGGTKVHGSHFLAKPFGLDVLTRRVREILDSEWTEESTPG